MSSFAMSPTGGDAAATGASSRIWSFDVSKDKVAHAETKSPPRGEMAQIGPLRRAWEGFRDLCFVIQDSKIFQHLTTFMIIANAIVLAITWLVRVGR